MRSTPVIFSAEMVRAILDGKKTQTRRLIKSYISENIRSGMSPLEWESVKKICPYGTRKDKLWVRETFVLESQVEHDQNPPYSDGRPIGGYEDSWLMPHYRATDQTPDLMYEGSDEPNCKWKPSIFMPRWASRICLEIEDIWIERLQDISEEDAADEGCNLVNGSYVNPYKNLWQSIYGDDSWSENPWVWVVKFIKV